jgi:XTP/dITP diphosphohydrolase
MKILIATTNEGKYKEMIHTLADLPFEFLSLKDLNTEIKDPEETEDTLEGNALLKARYYGDKTGLVTISEDTGLFAGALDGWPGVRAARVSTTDDGRLETLLKEMEGIKKENRHAEFKTSCVCYNPTNGNTMITEGIVKGEILETASESRDIAFGYNPVFYVPEIGKVFSEMTLQEKNSISQRGKAIKKMAYHLDREFAARTIVVPCGLIISEGKLLLAKRYDPHNPDYHGKWELPGGVIELGEALEENLKRELLEETNYEVEIIKQINYIHKVDRIKKDFSYQAFLIPYVCKVLEKNGDFNDAEIMEIKWIDPDEYVDYEYLGNNKTMMDNIIDEVKNIIEENNL